jgi:hypothetical protein
MKLIQHTGRKFSRPILAVALIATTSTVYTQSAQAGWFWPLIAGTVARGAATTVARTAAVTAVRRAAIGAAAVGATAGYAAAASADEAPSQKLMTTDASEYVTPQTQYCVTPNRQSIYILPQDIERCLDGVQPITKVYDFR